MGRRSLPKIDPNLDLSSWLIPEDQLPRPLAAAHLFPRSAPLEIEVGSGRGLFLAQAVAALPDHDFLGIERAGKYARYAAAGLAEQASPNGKIVHGDGVRVFRELLPDCRVAAVHVYFPDPWWKKRHEKRRIMTADFLRDIQRVLVAGGMLHFWTDVQAYFHSTLELIAATTDLDGPAIPEPSPAGHDFDYRTHFERRMRLRDVPVHRSQFQKKMAS